MGGEKAGRGDEDGLAAGNDGLGIGTVQRGRFTVKRQGDGDQSRSDVGELGSGDVVAVVGNAGHQRGDGPGPEQTLIGQGKGDALYAETQASADGAALLHGQVPTLAVPQHPELPTSQDNRGNGEQGAGNVQRGGGENGLETVEALVDDGGEQVVLAPKVPVQRTGPDPDLGGDVAHADPVEAVLPEQAGSGGQHLLPTVAGTDDHGR